MYIKTAPVITYKNDFPKRKNQFDGIKNRKKELVEREPNGRVSRKLSQDYSIYLIAADAESDMIKIGSSRDPKKRVSTIDTSCPYRALLVYEKQLTGKNALILENEIHKYLKKTPFHISGEWYSISVSTAIAIINKSLEKLNLT
jgi:hypothetical protein